MSNPNFPGTGREWMDGVEIRAWMLLPFIPVCVVAALYDLREFIFHLCAWFFSCTRSLLPQPGPNHNRTSQKKEWAMFTAFQRWFSQPLPGVPVCACLCVCLLSQSKAFLANLISKWRECSSCLSIMPFGTREPKVGLHNKAISCTEFGQLQWEREAAAILKYPFSRLKKKSFVN